MTKQRWLPLVFLVLDACATLKLNELDETQQRCEVVQSEKEPLQPFATSDMLTYQKTFFSVSINADGTLVAVGSDKTGVKLFDGKTGKLLSTLDGVHASFSADGKMLATSSQIRIIHQTNKDGKKTRTLEPNTIWLWSIKEDKTTTLTGEWNGPLGRGILSPDHRLLLTSEGKLFDTEKKALLYSLQGLVSRNEKSVFSPDGAKVVLEDANTLRVFDTATGKLLASQEGVGHASFVSEHQILAWNQSREKNKTILWDLRQPAKPSELTGLTDRIELVMSGQQGPLVFTADDNANTPHENSDLRLWDAAGNIWAKKDAFIGDIQTSVSSKNGEWLFLSGVVYLNAGDGRFLDGTKERAARNVLWNLRENTMRSIEHSFILGSDLSQDGSLLALIGEDQRLRLFSTKETQSCTENKGWVKETIVPTPQAEKDGGKISLLRDETILLTGHNDAVIDLVFSPDGKRLATSGSYPPVRFWDLPGKKLIFSVHYGTPAFQKQIYGVSFSPDGKQAMIVREGGIDVFSSEGVLQHTLKFQWGGKAATKATFSPDGEQIITIGEDIQRWDAHTGRLLQTIPVKHLSGYSPNHAFFSEGGAYVALMSAASLVSLWDVEQKKILFTLEHAWRPTFSRDNSLFAVAWHDTERHGDIDVWGTKEKKKLVSLQGNGETILSMSISSDGERLVSTSYDGVVTLFSLKTGKKLADLVGHQSMDVNKATFSPNGKQIATVGDDGLTILWDGLTGKQLQIIKGHEKSVRAVMFSPDGSQLATGSTDSTVRVLPITSGF